MTPDVATPVAEPDVVTEVDPGPDLPPDHGVAAAAPGAERAAGIAPSSTSASEFGDPGGLFLG